MPTIGYDNVPAEVVEGLFNEINKIAQPYGVEALNAAALSIAIVIQKPDIQRKQLIEVVRSTSEFIAIQLLEPVNGVN